MSIHTFPKTINIKVNEIERLEFELKKYDVAVRQFIHFSMSAPTIFKLLTRYTKAKTKIILSPRLTSEGLKTMSKRNKNESKNNKVACETFSVFSRIMICLGLMSYQPL